MLQAASHEVAVYEVARQGREVLDQGKYIVNLQHARRQVEAAHATCFQRMYPHPKK